MHDDYSSLTPDVSRDMNICPGRSPLAAFGALTIGRFSTVDRGERETVIP